MGEDAVSVDALAEIVKGHSQDIRQIRQTQEDHRAEWREALDKLRDNVEAADAAERAERVADAREFRGMLTTGLQAVRDDQQEGQQAIQEHLSEQDAKLEARRNTWVLILGSALATGAVTVAAAAAMHAWGL